MAESGRLNIWRVVRKTPAISSGCAQHWPNLAPRLSISVTTGRYDGEHRRIGAALSRIPTPPLEARPQKIRYGSLSGPTSEDHKGAVRNRCITPHEVAVPGNRIGVGNEHPTGTRGRKTVGFRSTRLIGHP